MYQRFFDGDNPLWRGMGLVFDLFVLNVLWLLCALPVVTLLPATAALCRCVQLLRRGEETYIHRDFFCALRDCLCLHWKALALQTLVGGFLAADVFLARSGGKGVFTFLMVFFFVLLLVWLFQLQWFLSTLSSGAASDRQTLLLAFYNALRFLPRTLLSTVLLILTLWLIHLFPGLVFLGIGLLVWADMGVLQAAPERRDSEHQEAGDA